jgi:excisionase family DNA binding protein
LVEDVSPQIQGIHQKLDLLIHETRQANQRFLGVADAAGLAGLSIESIRRLLAAGKLTALRPVRGKILIDRRELESMVLNSTATPKLGRGRARSN